MAPATARAGMPTATKCWNSSTSRPAARERASSGEIVPSVSISIVSLSWLVSWPTRTLSIQ